MKLCRVVGHVVATVKHRAYEGRKLMIVQPMDERHCDAGPPLLAVDTVQSGPGDIVLVLQEGNGVRQILGEKQLPIRSLVVGIVDRVDVVVEPGPA